MILTVFFAKEKTKVQRRGIKSQGHTIEKWQSHHGNPKAFSHKPSCSIAPGGAGVPELLTADPVVPRMRQRTKIHMLRKQKQT